MKYVLVDNYDNITHQKDFDSNIEYSSIKEYFIKLKATDAGVDELSEKVFDKIWKVMTEEDYNTQFKSSLQNRQVEWWKEEPSGPDKDFDY